MMSSLFKKSEEHYCEQGIAALSGRRLQEAEAHFSKGIKAYPRSFALYANRANVWLMSGDFVRAAQDFTSALDASPANPSVWAFQLKRGTCYVRTEQNAAALKDLDAALASAPDGSEGPILASGYFFRALVHMDDDVTKALSDARKAVQLDPEDGRYHKLMADLEVRQSSPDAMRLGQAGATHLQAARYDEALACFEELLALEPDHAKAWQMKGAALHALRRYEDELVALNRSYELNGNEVALFNRAYCHAGLGRLEEARRDLSLFVERGTHEATVQQARAMLAKLQ